MKPSAPPEQFGLRGDAFQLHAQVPHAVVHAKRHARDWRGSGRRNGRRSGHSFRRTNRVSGIQRITVMIQRQTPGV